jgi:uncharacterized membrane protein YbhN (UPF0104 family)
VRILRKHLVFVAKWAWVACVLAAAGVLVHRRWDGIVAMLRQVSLPQVAASIGLTALAKAGLAQNAKLAARRNGIELDFATSARLYNLSQLGKYLPGSIWQFVGRAAAYRRLGAGYAAIRDALLVESLWIVAAAAAVGLAFSGPAAARLVQASLTPMLRWWLGGGILAVALAVLAAVVLKRALAARYLRLAIPSVPVVLAQLATWLLLGLAFWVLARACGLQVGYGFAIGLFAAAYAVGFLVPFAPAGLGIRDGILTLGLLPYVPAGEALAVTVLARAVYLIVDVGLVVVQEPLFSAFGGRGRYSGG